MFEITPIGTVQTTQKAKSTSFRAATKVPTDNELDTFVKEQEKARKNAKKQQNLNTGIQLAVLACLAGTLGVMVHDKGWFKKFKLEFRNLSKEMDLNEMALPESQKEAMVRISNFIEHHKEIMEMGGPKGSSILFYGPPGTGKNTFAYAIAKKYPNAKFLEMDISKMNSKWHGESEQNVLGTMSAAIKYANKHPKEKIFVFIDEIDSVMMQDMSSNAKLSNDILNAFKKGFNELTRQENIVVIGATNVPINSDVARLGGKVLDSAMLDRFAEKVLVDLPTKDQLKLAITNYYKNPSLKRVDDVLKNIDDPRIDKIAEFLADPKRGTSFRKLTKGILEPAASSKPYQEGDKATMDRLIDSIKNNKDNLNATDEEMKNFLNSVK